MRYVAFKDMNTKQSLVVMGYFPVIPSMEWMNQQQFAVDDENEVVQPLQQPQ